uniref:DDE Tnp4 domain-containing protein n=1 Tax=Lactuca sativa TaxID=4236 RepID=A0A9R1X3U5_LACSA|nr:hypothetical protein LSAT_V11C600319140 [Lactuca sativa]
MNKGCLGAIDGTHISVHVPEADKPRYKNRKGEITTNVLVACIPDMQLCITRLGRIFCRWYYVVQCFEKMGYKLVKTTIILLMSGTRMEKDSSHHSQELPHDPLDDDDIIDTNNEEENIDLGSQNEIEDEKLVEDMVDILNTLNLAMVLSLGSLVRWKHDLQSHFPTWE